MDQTQSADRREAITLKCLAQGRKHHTVTARIRTHILTPDTRSKNKSNGTTTPFGHGKRVLPSFDLLEKMENPFFFSSQKRVE